MEIKKVIGCIGMNIYAMIKERYFHKIITFCVEGKQ